MTNIDSLNAITIAFACDENYAKHVAVVMQSIFANAAPDDSHEFHILTMGLLPDTENRLRLVAINGGATITIHQVPVERLQDFPESRQTLNAYSRLLLPEIIINKDKILYLDADLLVLDSLSSLWSYPLNDYALAVSPDCMAYFGGSAIGYFEELNLNKDHVYFNSGVMLLSLKVLRSYNLLDKVLSWSRENLKLMAKFNQIDQAALNVLLSGKVSYLHPRWNLQVPLIYPVIFGWGTTKELNDAVSKPGIIHFVTERKPWLRQYKLPYQHTYFYFLAQTPFSNAANLSLTFSQNLLRFREELNWLYQSIRSKVRYVLGRYPKPVVIFEVLDDQN